jgi:hypothetical protein
LRRVWNGPGHLRDVHRAHAARILYDNLPTMLGRPDHAGPLTSAGRAAAAWDEAGRP